VFITFNQLHLAENRIIIYIGTLVIYGLKAYCVYNFDGVFIPFDFDNHYNWKNKTGWFASGRIFSNDCKLALINLRRIFHV